MKIEDLIDQFCEDLTEDALFIWCDILKVEHDEDTWFDDQWPDKSGKLRTRLAEAMERIGK
jgi:hypothetical protein